MHVTPLILFGAAAIPSQFLAHALDPTERNHSDIDKEVLVIIYKFYHFIYDVIFTLNTDYKPLIHMFNESAMASIRLTLSAY